MLTLQPVILCGGSGTRLWPTSRKHHPKPFLPLMGEETLLQQTIKRLSDIDNALPPIVVAGEAHANLVRAQAPGCPLIVEPAARNTAPAIALAAHRADPDTVLLVCPSDHFISDTKSFGEAVMQAAALAANGRMVSIGIAPDRPETGYGYIQLGEPLEYGHITARFVEKPDLARAEQFLADGNFVWNAGIFVLRAGAFLTELERHRPQMASAVAQAASAAKESNGAIYPAAAPFAQIAGESIDYAVMEQTHHAAVVVADMGWTDIGDWSALAQARDHRSDSDGNLLSGPIDVLQTDNCMIESDGPRVSVVGLSDAVVIVANGEVLVTSKRAAQSVGKLPGAVDQ